MKLRNKDDLLNGRSGSLKKKMPRINRVCYWELLNKHLPLKIEPVERGAEELLFTDEDAYAAFCYPNEFVPFKKRFL